jgi:hypothetical protein
MATMCGWKIKISTLECVICEDTYDYIVKFACEFKEDYGEGNCHARDPGEEGGGTNHREDAGGDIRHELAHETPKERSCVKSRDDYTRRNLGAKGYDGEDAVECVSLGRVP